MTQTKSDESFSKDFHIRRSWEFLYCKDKGSKIRGRYFILSYAPPLTENTRLGVIVSKKVNKKAVERNKVKRRIREIFRKNRKLFSQTIDLVVIARQNASEISLEETKKDLFKLYRKAGILDAENYYTNNPFNS